MPRKSGIALFEFRPPPSKKSKGSLAASRLVSQVVGPPAVSIDMMKMLQERAREK
jgi:hypothetical protein